MDGVWSELGGMCETKQAPTTDTIGFKMTNLRGDTYYRIEVRAHNAIGFSKPLTLLMRTAIGESPNILGSLLYHGGIASATSNLSMRINNLLFVLFSFYVPLCFLIR